MAHPPNRPPPGPPAPPADVEEFGRQLTRDASAVCGDALVGVYLHGSAALGDWRSPGSDVDVLIIVDGWRPDAASQLGEVLRRAALRSPGAGTEVSVVSADAAAQPIAPYPYLLHVAGSRIRPIRVIDGTQRPGDDDLILHYVVCRARGIAWAGPPAGDVIAPLDRPVVLGQLAAELRWALAEAPPGYALLNACRALTYLHEGAVLSKSDGARWALARGVGPTRSISAALAARSSDRQSADPPLEIAFIEQAIGRLSEAALDAISSPRRDVGR